MAGEGIKPQLFNTEKGGRTPEKPRVVLFHPDEGEPFEVDLDKIELCLWESQVAGTYVPLDGTEKFKIDDELVFEIIEKKRNLGEITLTLGKEGVATVKFGDLQKQKRIMVPLEISEKMIFAKALNKLFSSLNLKRSVVANAGKGIGKEVYSKLGTYLKENHNIILRSSTSFSQSSYAKHMWASLERMGLAKRIKEKGLLTQYEFVGDSEKETPTTT